MGNCSSNTTTDDSRATIGQPSLVGHMHVSSNPSATTEIVAAGRDPAHFFISVDHVLQCMNSTIEILPIAELMFSGVIRQSGQGGFFQPAGLFQLSSAQTLLTPAEWSDVLTSINHATAAGYIGLHQNFHRFSNAQNQYLHIASQTRSFVHEELNGKWLARGIKFTFQMDLYRSPQMIPKCMIIVSSLNKDNNDGNNGSEGQLTASSTTLTLLAPTSSSSIVAVPLATQTAEEIDQAVIAAAHSSDVVVPLQSQIRHTCGQQLDTVDVIRFCHGCGRPLI